MIFAVSNGLLYVCFALVIGHCILSMLPEDKKPRVVVPKKWQVGSVLLIPMLSLPPVLHVTLNMNEYREESFISSFIYVLMEIELGRAWTALLLLVIIFAALMWLLPKRRDDSYVNLAGLLLVFGMIVTQGVVGHSANMASYPGATSHILHLMAVSTWVGILMIVSWFAVNDENWEGFVDWFTPIAVICVIVVSFSGVFMTFFLTENIMNSWMLTYGQALLFKHLLFIPLMVYACINGFLMRRKVKNTPTVSPRSWWRAESLIIMAVFVITGFMSEQEPPQNIAQTLNREGSSILFQSLVTFPVNSDTELFFHLHWFSLLFFLIGIVFLLLVIYVFYKNDTITGSIVFGVLAVISIYFGIISGVEAATYVEETSVTSLLNSGW
ncbi:putative copper resistance protein D [Alteribacillus persepolensis]|uniref:Putative copper resistance protein D n=1 Tax=Alteribacillus persepolensis TaxID=568899 RepID=A0A1G8FWH1_9BACI|nr:CopD family protein [Alteribacillus persepolensis]SDH86316.1 putative copper resistance protein D [Alteribacillus persepolensis]